MVLFKKEKNKQNLESDLLETERRIANYAASEQAKANSSYYAVNGYQVPLNVKLIDKTGRFTSIEDLNGKRIYPGKVEFGLFHPKNSGPLTGYTLDFKVVEKTLLRPRTETLVTAYVPFEPTVPSGKKNLAIEERNKQYISHVHYEKSSLSNFKTGIQANRKKVLISKVEDYSMGGN